MNTYTKQPVDVQAFQVDASRYMNPDVWPDWAKKAWLKNTITRAENSDVLYIETNSGNALIALDDWLIKGVEDEIYPCPDTVFRKTYTPAQDLLARITVLNDVVTDGDDTATVTVNVRLFLPDDPKKNLDGMEAVIAAMGTLTEDLRDKHKEMLVRYSIGHAVLELLDILEGRDDKDLLLSRARTTAMELLT